MSSPGKAPPARLAAAGGLRGAALLHDPRYNKGTAFTAAERDALGLHGLLPPRVLDMQEQLGRVLRNFNAQPSALERYVYLAALQDRNETLFFRTLIDHIEEMLPVVYTPTVGEACREFGRIFRRPRGLYLTADDRGRMREVLRNWPEPGVRVIVVTDGERILGLGDLGANGMGIPIGKLNLYTACAGVPPQACLPVMLDVGTDNSDLLEDPLYTGITRRRLRGADYHALADEFVAAANDVFPGVLVQFEDFATENALALLARHRNTVCTFNDDIQGTAAVILSGLLSSARITGVALKDQRLLFLGAGAAAVGVADLIVSALARDGMNEAEARGHCNFVDTRGLVTAGRDGIAAHKLPYAHDRAPAATLRDSVQALRPTGLIGLSTSPGAFSEPVLRAMAACNERPVIFALSNPTAKAECTATEAYRATDGRAIFASGSPFAPVNYRGRRFVPGQGNNAYIFPGIGLGVLTARARRVTNEMFHAAAQTLAGLVPQSALAEGLLFPPLATIREVSFRIAAAVATLAWRDNLAAIPQPADIEAAVRAEIYDPVYPEYV
jgi:malate dehydrogenase (oxaloacetate-decarboxylating)(NADP+)